MNPDLTSADPLKTPLEAKVMTDAIADRIRGAILAAAIGNSLGGTFLGVSRKEAMFSGFVHGLHDFTPAYRKSLLQDYQPGMLLSDTLMSIQLAESLIQNKGQFNSADFKQRLSSLLSDDEFMQSAPGAHCLLGPRRLCEGPECEEPDSDSTHVAAAARAYPIGCLPGSIDTVKLAIEQAKVSHPDQRVSAAAAVLAYAVRSFVHGMRLDNEAEVKQFVKVHFEIASRIDERFAEAWDDVAPDLDYSHPADELPYSLINVDSHVNEAVPTAVGIFLIFRHDLEEAVAAAASSGGDTDTVAAIVGALSGAYHGASAIPERWLKQISQRDRLERVADQLIALWKK